MIAAARPVQTNRYKVWCGYGSRRGPSISTSLLLHSFTCYTPHLTSHCSNYANVPTSPTLYPAAHHLDCLALWFNTRRTHSSTAERPRGFLLVRLWCTSTTWRVVSAARKWQNSGQPCNECGQRAKREGRNVLRFNSGAVGSLSRTKAALALEHCCPQTAST